MQMETQKKAPKMTTVLEEVLKMIQLPTAKERPPGWSQYICDNVHTLAKKQDGLYRYEIDQAWEALADYFGLCTYSGDEFCSFYDGPNGAEPNEKTQFARAMTITFMLEFLKDNPEFERV